LDAVVERGKFESKYELLQYLISVFLKFADPENENEDEEAQEVVEFARLFEGWDDYRQRIITTKPQGNRHLNLTDIVCIYSEVGKKGYVGKKISLNASETKITDNVGNVLDVVLKKLYPMIYEKLNALCEQVDERSISKALEKLLVDLLNDVDSETLARIFADEKGEIEYGNVPKRKRHMSINNV
jgi:hypothetical protein